ncbi:MAG: hypothetical protein R2692_08350 [Microbacterium sp.]
MTGPSYDIGIEEDEVTSPGAEEVFPEVIACQLNHVAHRLIPPPLVFVVRDAVAVADLDGVNLARLDLAGR